MFAMALLVRIPTFETIDQCEQLKSLVFAESGTTSYNRSNFIVIRPRKSQIM